MLSTAPLLPAVDTPLEPHPPHSTLPASTLSEPEFTLPNFEPHAIRSNSVEIDMAESTPRDPAEVQLHLHDLPIEIHEAILDHLFGVRHAALGSITSETPTASTWSKSLRHPRRKALSNLALVSSRWRTLVQERIYRHSKCPLRLISSACFVSHNIQYRLREQQIACRNALTGLARARISPLMSVISKFGSPFGEIACPGPP